MNSRHDNVFSTHRYVVFAKVAPKIIEGALQERKERGLTGFTDHSTHLSRVLSVEDIEDILRTNELRATEAWSAHYKRLAQDPDELKFDDFPELDGVLEESDHPQDVAAQILALHDSFAGFVRTLACWVDNQDLFGALVSSVERSGEPAPRDVLGIIESTLEDEVEDLMGEDAPDAAIFIYSVSINQSS